jgi:zinc protease
LFETLGSLRAGVSNIVTYDRDLDYLNQLPALYDEPTLEDVKAVAQKYIKPNQWTWLIVGDLDKIEEPIRKLNLGEMEILD